jgi:hypothetical protein
MLDEEDLRKIDRVVRGVFNAEQSMTGRVRTAGSAGTSC